MAVTVARVDFERSYAGGRGVLEQRFHFEGGGVDAAAIASILLTAPLTGEGSVFGTRPGEETKRTDTSRSMSGFSPAPGFRFDVDLARRDDGVFVVHFSQPDRNVPYLQGDLLWILSDREHGAAWVEHINTERALAEVDEPLGGPRPSLRRRLFFFKGHQEVMLRATRNVAGLLSARRG